MDDDAKVYSVRGEELVSKADYDRLRAQLALSQPLYSRRKLEADNERMRAALVEITRRTGLLIMQNTGRWNVTVEHDARTMGVLGGNQEIAREALKQ